MELIQAAYDDGFKNGQNDARRNYHSELGVRNVSDGTNRFLYSYNMGYRAGQSNIARERSQKGSTT